MPDGEEFGLERLVAACVDRLDASAESIATAIFDAVAAHRGRAAAADDVTVLIVKRH